MDFPTPGSPATNITDPGTMPPPSTRLSSWHGADVASTWASLLAGRSAIIQKTIAVKGLDEYQFEGPVAPCSPDALTKLIGKFTEKQIASVDLFSNFGASATLEALSDAGLVDDAERLERAAIIYGSASGGHITMEAAYERVFLNRLPNVHPMTIPRYMNSANVSYLSMIFGVRGHCLAVSSACATSAHAIGEAMHLIRAGRASIVITGGSDASLTYGSLRSWAALQAMATDTCRPFSMGRNGMVIGEGAATLILEEEEHARKRGAKIYAEVKPTLFGITWSEFDLKKLVSTGIPIGSFIPGLEDISCNFFFT